ncbi:LexA family protein [Legionella fairfieldensis]|uniref:LexA family protein n=1 Tax=Legionella fairfieldensis TaxID=45064 RepID=UPI0004909079|nr:translesion error-prone DNA polymerase V autoproteolytic subunit [Legionella fairfieldensis]
MTNQRGGKRPGAGRPKGLNQYGETTQPIRIPLSRIAEVKQFLNCSSPTSALAFPLYSSTVRAGFPSPADDTIENYLDLNEYLIAHPAATFFVRASGDSMNGAGINEGDLLLVDRSLEPLHGKIVIAALNGELTVKRLSKKEGKVQLLPENNTYPPLDITGEEELVIWGVVKHIIKTV